MANAKKWWTEDWTQEIGLIVLGLIAVLALLVLGEADAKLVAVGVAGVIGGYLTGKKQNGGII